MIVEKINKFDLLLSGFSGIKPKISFWKKYFPIPPDRFITFNYDPSDYGLTYPLFTEVLELIVPALSGAGIAVVDCSFISKERSHLCYRPFETVSFSQSNSIISRGELHVTNHNWSDYAARSMGKDVITISNKDINDRRYNGHNNDCYLFDEDFIKPEVVANLILRKLNIDYTIIVKSLSIGGSYANNLIEIVPDYVPDNLPPFLISVRLDLCEDYVMALNIINKFGANNCILVVDKPIPEEWLSYFSKCKLLTILINDNITMGFLGLIESFSYNYNLIFKGLDDSGLNDLKLKFFDYRPIDFFRQKRIEELKIFDDVKSSTFVKNRKIIFSKDGLFNSIAHYKNGLEASSPNGNIVGDLLDDQEFLDESECFYFYEIK